MGQPRSFALPITTPHGSAVAQVSLIRSSPGSEGALPDVGATLPAEAGGQPVGAIAQPPEAPGHHRVCRSRNRERLVSLPASRSPVVGERPLEDYSDARCMGGPDLHGGPTETQGGQLAKRGSLSCRWLRRQRDRGHRRRSCWSRSLRGRVWVAASRGSSRLRLGGAGAR